jgi:hypothetical protein
MFSTDVLHHAQSSSDKNVDNFDPNKNIAVF